MVDGVGFDDWLKRTNHLRIILDVTYLGLTTADTSYVGQTHPNVEAVIFSLSKPFGVYYHRIGGVFSRREIPSLYGNLWFKNLFSLRLGTELMTRYHKTYIPNKYKQIQKLAVSMVNNEDMTGPQLSTSYSVEASPVVILATSADGSDPQYKRDRRTFRYCLTPLMTKVINRLEGVTND
jgi:hypothetical protein